jgi:hypothetical protein
VQATLNSGDAIFCLLGEFGWISEPGGIVRMTKYTADRQGYRVRHITRGLERETREKEKGGVVALNLYYKK